MTEQRKRPNTMIAIIAGAACIALITSCAANAKRKQSAPASTNDNGADEAGQPSQPGQPRSQEHETQIRELVRQIHQLEQTTKASNETRLGAVCTAPAPKTTRCTDVCKLRGSICNNAQKICELAKGIPDNTWATEQCTNAKTSCEHATKRCCGCVEHE